MSSSVETSSLDRSLRWGRDDNASKGGDNVKKFQQIVRQHYHDHSRDLAWRPPQLKLNSDGMLDPYRITISEIMLQQTQVSRVSEKFPGFIERFANFQTLATSETADVIRAWQGLGYNRRALNLQKLAQMVVRDYGGKLPGDPIELSKLPGVGPQTAGSIAAFAFNYPSVFIETNIRRVFIYHFFTHRHPELNSGPSADNWIPDQVRDDKVSDKQLLPLVEAALDRTNPREWYYALMDYGSYLARTVSNPNRQSRHYAKQSKFEGSNRQIRGQILRLLADGPSDLTEISDPRRDQIAADLMKEGFVRRSHGRYGLA